MSHLAMALMGAAFILTALKAGTDLEGLIPDGEHTSIKYELAVMVITMVIAAVLAAALNDIIGPAGAPEWAAELLPPPPAAA